MENLEQMIADGVSYTQIEEAFIRNMDEITAKTASSSGEIDDLLASLQCEEIARLSEELTQLSEKTLLISSEV